MACRLLGAKPLPEPMSTNCQLSPSDIFIEILIKFIHFQSEKNAFENAGCEATLYRLNVLRAINRMIAPLPVNQEWSEEYGPFVRYVKLWVAHAPEMPERFSPPPRVSDPYIHRGTCVTHLPWCMSGSLASGRWRENRSLHSWRMHNPKFYVSGKKGKMGKIIRMAFQGAVYHTKAGGLWNIWVKSLLSNHNII